MSESSGLPPEQEAVRRLLADARHDGPPPPDVVARLDDTLASLVGRARVRAHRQPPATEHDDRSPGRVVDLGSRRRRVAGIGLLAAASVVVAGVAIGQALPRGGNDASESSAGSAVGQLARRVPRGRGGSERRRERQLRPRQRLAVPPSRAGVAEELSRQPRCAGRPDACSPTTTPTSTTSCLGPAARTGATRRQQLAVARRAPGLRRAPIRARAAALVAAEVDGRTGPGRVPSPRRRGAGRRALRLRRGRPGAYDHAARALSRCGAGVWNNGRLRSVEDDVPHHPVPASQQE